MKISILLIGILLITGCATLQGTGSIKEIKDRFNVTTGVTFDTNRQSEMSYKTVDVEYKYSSQQPTIMSQIVSVLTLGLVNTRR